MSRAHRRPRPPSTDDLQPLGLSRFRISLSLSSWSECTLMQTSTIVAVSASLAPNRTSLNSTPSINLPRLLLRRYRRPSLARMTSLANHDTTLHQYSTLDGCLRHLKRARQVSFVDPWDIIRLRPHPHPHLLIDDPGSRSSSAYTRYRYHSRARKCLLSDSVLNGLRR